MPLPSTVNCWVHNGDVDTSGGAAAITAALIGGEKGHTLGTANQIKIPAGGVRYLGAMTVDETVATLDADGYFTIGAKRRFDLPFDGAQLGTLTEMWFPGGMMCNAEDLIDYVGRSSGAGAEQHTLVHYVDQPKIGPAWALADPSGADSYMAVEAVTAALVAVTQSGFTDVCGRTTAYPGAQAKIPNDPAIRGVLYAITPKLSAGYSALCIRNPSETRCLVFPGCPAGTSGNARRFDLTKMLGGGLAFSADAPLLLGGIGVGTTAQTAILEMGLFGVGVDG